MTREGWYAIKQKRNSSNIILRIIFVIDSNSLTNKISNIVNLVKSNSLPGKIGNFLTSNLWVMAN